MKRLEEKMIEKGYKKAEVKKILGDMITSMEELLIAGEEVKLNKFVTLKKITKPARICNIPSTGEKKEIPEKLSVKLKLSSNLKEVLNK